MAVAEVPEQAIDATQQALAKDGVVQLALPAHTPVEIPEWVVNAAGFDWPSLQYSVWAALALVALILAFVVFRRLRGSFGKRAARAAAPEAEGWRPEAREARALLAEADRLAAEGRFAEAAHLLLLRSVEQIAAKRPDAVRPALTSRDIASQPALPRDIREAFGLIAALVERSLFAGGSVDSDAWTRCRSVYEAAAFGRAWA